MNISINLIAPPNSISPLVVNGQLWLLSWRL